MKNKKKYLLSIIAIALIAFAVYAYKEYNRQLADLTNETFDVAISATNLLNGYKLNEEDANKKYLGKTILITGQIAEIINKDTFVNIFLGDINAINKVSCVMDIKNKKIKDLPKLGQEITIKGVCTGFLADVEFNRCVIVKNK